ncbi:MAG TPA: choice-of-anchor P family protein, partial [Candidatus Saccharimonadales bacterium]|nr:choice-of-anchor P family protein [Candidatus Saccharimonadales bacterium]
MHTPNGKRAAMMAVALSILGVLATMDLCWSRNASAAAPKTAAKVSPAPARPPAPGRKGVTVQAVEYSGQATLINFTNIHMGPPFVIIGDTGPLPSTGGDLQVSVDPTNMVGLSLDLGSASTRGIDDAASSAVSLNNLSVTIETVVGTRHTLVAESIMLDAAATCTATGPVLTAHSQIVGLTVDGTPIEVTGQPNQLVDLGDASLVLNEQVLTYGDMSAAIALAAIHIIDPECLDGLVGLVHADIKCNSIVPPPPTSQCDDFVTGGGWIIGPNNAKANFGVAGGVRKDAFWGHLNFIDHGTGLHVKSTAVTGYEVTDATTRTINYDVTIDGEAGTAVVRVVDNGEPGRDDVFQISLSNGYVAGGSLGGDQPGGGNIQLHHGKCHDVDCEHKCPKCGHKCHHEHKNKKCHHECDREDHQCPWDQNKCEHKCDKCDHQCEHHDHKPGNCNHKC